MADLKPYLLKRMGKHAVRLNDPYNAIDLYEALLSKKTTYKNFYALAHLYERTRDYRSALSVYTRMQRMFPKKNDLLLYDKGLILKSMGIYDKALLSLSKFRQDYKGKNKNYYRKRAKILMEGCDLAMDAKDSLNYETKGLEGSVNQAHIEFSPNVLDDEHFIFGSLKSNEQIFFSDDERPRRQFYYAQKDGKTWNGDSLWLGGLKVKGEVGNGCFNREKDEFYFSVCNPDWKNEMHCAIYMLKKYPKTWSDPIPLPKEINSNKYSVSQPAIGINPKNKREVLYFVSDRPGGKGGKDIWYSEYDPKRSEWKNPRNCGSKINGSEEESSPYIDHAQGKFFFSSSSHAGIGGLDVFQTLGSRSSWTKAANLGPSLNSSYDDLYYVQYAEGKKGFFVSNRSGTTRLKTEHCCDDIFSFERKAIEDVSREVELLEFDLSDSLSKKRTDEEGKPVIQKDVNLYTLDEETDEEIYLTTLTTDEKGRIEVPLDLDREYLLKMEDPSYLTESVRIKTGKAGKPIESVLRLNKIALAEIVVPNIYYPFDEYYLTEDARHAIDTSIYKIMLENPEIIVEIGSHTDSKGSFPYNMNLSNNRAKSVVNYLRKLGIDKQRLSYKGYGEAKPLVPNEKADGSDDVVGRAKNRRTSFRVIGRLVDGEKVIYKDDFKATKADR